MRKSYASGYSRATRSEPSLAWFVLGAIAIGVGYLYISSLGSPDDKGQEKSPESEAAGTGGQPGAVPGGDEDGEVAVRPAVPVSDVISEGAPESGSAWMTGSRLVLAWIPGGKYMVRTEDGISTRKFGGGYWMAVRPVEESEFEEVMGVNPVPEGKRDPSAPVTRVSWEDAKEYAVQLTLKERNTGKLPSNYEYRIPTEMMWEYAVGGGDDGSAIRVREEDSRDLTWWRINGLEEFQDSNHQGPLRAGSLDVGTVSEWTVDEEEDGQGTVVVRGAPHTAFLGREESVVKSRYLIYHKDEKLPFLGFRVIMVKTGADRVIVEEGTIDPAGTRTPVTVRPLVPGEPLDYVERRDSFNLEELFESSVHSRESSLNKYNLLREVQTELKKNGYYAAKVDGYPGKSTQRAIDKFQAASGLPKSGRLDDQTLQSLGIRDESGRSETAARTGEVVRPSPVPSLPVTRPEGEVNPNSGSSNPLSDSVPRTAEVAPLARVSEEEPEPGRAPEEPVIHVEPEEPVARAVPVETRREPATPRAVPMAPRPTHPRAIPASTPEVSELPRARPAGSYQPTPPPPLRIQPQPAGERELRYDGFRGKLRQLGDAISGTYDEKEDRKRR